MAKTTKTNTALPAINKVTMADVPLFLERIRAEIKSLKADDSTGPMASGDIPGYGNPDNITDVIQLIKAKAAVRESAESFENELKLLNKDPRFSLAPLPKKYKIGNYTVDAWLNKLDSRIIEITQADKIKSLKEMEKQLAQFETEEQKLQSALSKIGELFTA